MPLLGTQPSDGSGPSPVSKSLQDERRSLEEREGRTPGKESPFPLSLGSQPFHYSKTMPQTKIFCFIKKKNLPLLRFLLIFSNSRDTY